MAKKKKKEEEPQAETVTLPKDKVNQLLNRLDDQERAIQKLKEESSRAIGAADKGRLAHYDQKRQSGELIPQMKLAVVDLLDDNQNLVLDEDGNPDRRVVLGWKMLKDDVRIVDTMGQKQIISEQVMRLYLENRDEDGELTDPLELDLQYAEFYSRIDRVTGDVVGERTDRENGVNLVTIRLEDGREFEVDVRFVNP